MSPLESQHDDDESSEEQNLVPFLDHMIPEKDERELRQFCDEVTTRGDVQFWANLKRSICKEDGKIVIRWHGDMDLWRNKVSFFPSDLRISGRLRLAECPNLTAASFPKTLHAGTLTIIECDGIEELPEGMHLGCLNLRKLKNLRTFPNDITIQSYCLIDEILFGLDYEVFKKIYAHKAEGRIGGQLSFPLTYFPEDTRDMFLKRILVSKNSNAKKYFIDHFSTFKDVPFAAEMGMEAMQNCDASVRQPWYLLNYVFTEVPGQKDIALQELQKHFNIEDGEPSEELLNQAEFVLAVCIADTKRQTLAIQEEFNKSKADPQQRKFWLDLMRSIAPKRKQIIRIIFPESIHRRLAARIGSSEASKFLTF